MEQTGLQQDLLDIGTVAAGAALTPFTGGASLPAALGITALTSGAEAGGAAADEVTDLISDAVARGEIQGTPDQIAALTNTARNQAYTQAGTIGGLSDTAVAATLGTTGVAKAILKSPFIAQQAAKLGISLGSEFGAGVGEQVVTNLAAQRAGADVGATQGAIASGLLETTGTGPGAATAVGVETAARGVGALMPTGGPGTVPTSGLPAASVLDPSKSPTSGQLATSTVPTAYDATSTSLDTIAAQNLVEDLVGQYGNTVGSGGIPRAELEKISDATNVSIEELGRMIGMTEEAMTQQALQNIQDTPGNLTIVPQPDETVQGLAALPGNLTAVPQPDDAAVIDDTSVTPEFTTVRTDTGVDTEETATPEFVSTRGTGVDTEGESTTEGTSTVTIATDVEDELPEVEVEVEDEVVDTDTGVEVDVDSPMVVPPETRTNDEGEEIVECPEGYTMVQTPEGPICQKNVTSVRQRAGAGTRAYTGLATRGQRGPGQRRVTVTDTERVDPITRSA